MTPINDIIMDTPEILLYIDEINHQKEKMKLAWLNTFWQKLKSKLYEIPGSKIENYPSKSSKIIKIGCSKYLIYKEEQKINFIFLVERWNNTPNLLRVVAGLHDYDNRDNIWNHFDRFPQLNEKIKRDFLDYHENPSPWIPAELPLYDYFANDEYLSKNLDIWDSNKGDELIDGLCNKIKRFIEIVNESIEDMNATINHH